MYNIKNKLIKIPKHITVVFDSKKKNLIFIGPKKIKFLNLQLKIKLIKQINSILITSFLFTKISNSNLKTIKSLQGTTIALIKQCFIETTYTLYKKLKLVGVGYKVFSLDSIESKLLMFKLGYSHPIYFKVPKNLKILSLKFTKIFVCGTSLQNVTQISSLIRSYKKPEPYKGKGILYENEKINLKEGKKV
jgi:large subunit ribosomal protein L6